VSYASSMGERGRPRLDLGDLLAEVENAPPVAAADVVGQLLAETLNASEVAFLIADFGGDAVIRLSHTRRLSTSAGGREIASRGGGGGAVRMAGCWRIKQFGWRRRPAGGGCLLR
jgi:hypothetical protein